MRWNNQIYKVTYNGMWGKLGNTTSAYYSSHMSRANADVLGFGWDDDFEDDIDSTTDGKTIILLTMR